MFVCKTENLCKFFYVLCVLKSDRRPLPKTALTICFIFYFLICFSNNFRSYASDFVLKLM